MTEPTSNQLKEARKISEALSILSAKDIAVFIAHIRREARNAALEEAAKSFDAIRFKAGAETVMYCYRASERIRALKDQP